MPSGINLSFERLSPSKGQVGYVLLTRAPVAIGCIATTMLPLDLHVLSLQLAFILSQDQTLHCKSIFNDFKFLIRTISPFCSVQDDSNLSLPIIISIDGSSFTRNLTISCQASLLYYLYCLCNSIIDRLSIRLTDFLSESGCKGKNFIVYLPNIFESFFSKVLFFISAGRLSAIISLAKGRKDQDRRKLQSLPRFVQHVNHRLSLFRKRLQR